MKRKPTQSPKPQKPQIMVDSPPEEVENNKGKLMLPLLIGGGVLLLMSRK